MTAPRLMVETLCEHGLLQPHDNHAGANGIGNLVCPLAGFSNECPHPGHCDGGTREEASAESAVAWLREQGAVEVELPDIAMYAEDNIVVDAGRYLVFPIDALSATGQEGEEK